MKEEIKKFKKKNKLKSFFYYFFIFGSTISSVFVTVANTESTFLGLVLPIIWFSLLLISFGLLIGFSLNIIKIAKHIVEGYKKESREQYGDIMNRAWVEGFKKKQERIKNKRLKICTIVFVISILIFLPLLTLLIIYGGDEMTPIAVIEIVFLSLSGAGLLLSAILIIGCFVCMKIKEYEIDGYLIIKYAYLNKEVLVLSGEEVAEVYTSWQEARITLPNGKEVEYKGGAVYFVEDADLSKTNID